MIERARANRAKLDQWISQSDWVTHLPVRPDLRPNTPVTMCLDGPRLKGLGEDQKRARAKAVADLLAAEGVAFDINAYRTAPPGLRVWTGGTVELADISALPPWLDWAFAATE